MQLDLQVLVAMTGGDPGGIMRETAGWLAAQSGVMGVIRVDGGAPALGSFDALLRSDRAVAWKNRVATVARRYPRDADGITDTRALDRPRVRDALLDTIALHACDRFVFVGDGEGKPSDWRRLLSGALSVPDARILCAGMGFDACNIPRHADPYRDRHRDGDVSLSHFYENAHALLTALADPTAVIEA